MTPTDLVAEVRARLKALPRGRAREVAGKAGIAYDTLLRIARGERNPRIETLQTLHEVLLAVEAEAA